MTDQLVLVTGASGFLATHCILQLLQQGYRVRGTLRTLSKGDDLRQTFAKHLGAEPRLEFVTADLMSDAGWDAAMQGCDYALHTASPLPVSEPEDEKEVILPAVEGTKRILKAAAAAGVKRVVLTSSVAAIDAGHDSYDRPLTEEDWSVVEKTPSAYDKSKTLAERAAWEFVKAQGSLELTAINPGLILGPVLGKPAGPSHEFILRLMNGRYPAVPRLGFAMVDVRDVAAAHVAAMTTPEAAGRRFCCTHEFLWMQDMAKTLASEFSNQDYRIPTGRLPNFLFHIAAFFDKSARLFLPRLGVRIEFSNEQIKRVLKWQPHPARDTILETARSLVEYDLVR